MNKNIDFNPSGNPDQLLSLLKTSALPEIDLYMDQLTTLMEEKLKAQRRYPDDKILTKTMINNYTKNRLLPPPINKKYSQDHLVTLLYTYYLKNIISISDITVLLQPMIAEYWGNFRREDSEDFSMKDIYSRILQIAPTINDDYHQDLTRKLDLATRTFEGASDDSQETEYLQTFAFCALLAFDVYMKKKMIESIIDQMRDEKQ